MFSPLSFSSKNCFFSEKDLVFVTQVVWDLDIVTGLMYRNVSHYIKERKTVVN